MKNNNFNELENFLKRLNNLTFDIVNYELDESPTYLYTIKPFLKNNKTLSKEVIKIFVNSLLKLNFLSMYWENKFFEQLYQKIEKDNL